MYNIIYLYILYNIHVGPIQTVFFRRPVGLARPCSEKTTVKHHQCVAPVRSNPHGKMLLKTKKYRSTCCCKLLKKTMNYCKT